MMDRKRRKPTLDAWLRVRVTASELRSFDEAAEAKGLDLSDFVRTVLRRAVGLTLGLLVGCGGSPFELLPVGVAPDSLPDAPTTAMLEHDGGIAGDSNAPTQTPATAPSSTASKPPDHSFRDAAPGEASAVVDAGSDVADSDGSDSASASPEAAPAPDASPTLDAAPEAAPPVCTPIATAIQYCGQSAAQLSVPSQYCWTSYNGPDYADPMPQECQCQETYTCACLLAHANPCSAPATVFGCISDGARSPQYVHATCK